MKKFLQLMWDTLAIRSLESIFFHDAHYIVSKKGWKIINKEDDSKTRT